LHDAAALLVEFRDLDQLHHLASSCFSAYPGVGSISVPKKRREIPPELCRLPAAPGSRRRQIPATWNNPIPVGARRGNLGIIREFA
jgi:hypothetical protein